MEVNCIIKDDGFLIEEDITTDPDDSLLETEDEIQSTQIQRPTDKPKERQDEQPLKSSRKRSHNNLQNNEKHQPRKRPRQETAESLSEKIRKSEESISKLRTHTEKGTCPKSLRYNARANITPDDEFKRDIVFIRKNAQQKYVDALNSCFLHSYKDSQT